jgi:hypothetical protein
MENREMPILHKLSALWPVNNPEGRKLFVCPARAGQTKNYFLSTTNVQFLEIL